MRLRRRGKSRSFGARREELSHVFGPKAATIGVGIGL